MAARKAALLVMAKMALVDGDVCARERAMLAPLLTPAEPLEALLEEAKTTPLARLIAELDRYADRFFVALRAKSMAHVDEQLDVREEALYEELVVALQILPADRLLIEDSVAALDALDPPPMHPRVAQLFQQSSFL